MKLFHCRGWIGILILLSPLFLLIVSQAQEIVEDSEEAMVTMDFQDVDLTILIKFISELTGKNFIIDDSVRGKKVTVISPTKITKAEAYRVFESILEIKGFSTVPAGKVIKIVQSKDAVEKSIQTVVGGQKAPISDTLITRLIPLEYVPAEDLVNIIKPLISKESKIDAYTPTNTIILTDTASNISRLMKIIQQLDIKFDEMIMEVIQLEYASADVLAKQLQEILQVSAPSPGAPPTTPRPPTRPSSRVSGKKAEGFSGKIIADDRTNSLITLTTKSELEKIRELIAKLDYDTPKAYGNINVYYLAYAKAEDAAKVLNELVSGTKSAGPKGGPQAGVPGGPSKTLESFEKEVSITADVATNSLVIVASPRDYQTLKNVIDKLDIRRNQVYVEAVVMEITPSFVRDLGFEFRGGVPLQSGDNVDRVMIGGTKFSDSTNSLLDKFATALAAQTGTSTTPTTTTQGTTSLNPLSLEDSGLTFGAIFDRIKIPGTDVFIPANVFLMHALQKDSKANILSTPHMLAIDNEEAEIVVGQNVPFISSTSQSAISSVTSINRENVGITLRFTPQINESNYVFLKLYEEISSIIESPVGMDANRVGPTTSTRKATNSALVKDGQTIVIGGLIEDRMRKSRSKVPWLGDIPFLGWAFRYDTETIEKTNLLIFLTPTILKEDQEVQKIYKEKKKKMQEYLKRQDIPERLYDVKPFEEDKQSNSDIMAPKEESLKDKDSHAPPSGDGKEKEDSGYKVRIKGAYPVPLDEDQPQENNQP